MLNIKSLIAYKKGNEAKAIQLLNESIELAKIHSLLSTESKGCYDLYNIYKNQNKSEIALKSFEKYKLLNDSLTELNRSKEFEKIKVKYEVFEMEKNLKNKDKELAIFEADKKVSNYKLVLLSFFGLGLLFFIYRQRKINQINKRALLYDLKLKKIKEDQLTTEMQYKNKEITEFAVHINERNRLLEEFSSKIKSVVSVSTEREVKNQLKNIQLFIKDNIQINQEKVEINTKVERTEDALVYNLKKEYPDLSPKELKVITYLVLGLSSKRIADLMGISKQSINNYRFFIRKKLKLTKEVNLIEFLKGKV